MKNAVAAAQPMDDYQAESDFHALTRAEEIKGDAKRHAKAISHGKGKVADMQAVVGEGAADKDAGGMKEGSKAEEALDAKQAKAAKKPAMPAGVRVTQRTPGRNKASVI